VDSIIIGFSRPKSWFVPFAWLIMLVTWCKFSHAYVRYENAYANRNMVFQASGLKVNFMGQTMFDGEENVYAEFNIPISDAAKLSTVQFAIDNVGSSYAVGQILGFPIVWFMAMFGKKIRNPFYSGSNYFCSELVCDILNEINGTALDSSVMTPKDIYGYLLSKGYQPVSAQSTAQS
jgi:hypothetical protein